MINVPSGDLDHRWGLLYRDAGDGGIETARPQWLQGGQRMQEHQMEATERGGRRGGEVGGFGMTLTSLSSIC